MRERNRIALKEWAVIVKAMKEGKQILLLRKGGIAEEGGEFRVVEVKGHGRRRRCQRR